jgi:hypothetical protein
MGSSKLMQGAWIAVVLLAGLACGAITDAARQFEPPPVELAETVQAAATLAQESGLLATAQAVVGGGAATVQAAATEYGDEAVATIQAAATQVKDANYPATLEALATERGPEARATAEALATQVHQFFTGSAPEDIPILPGSHQDLFASQGLVSYTTPQDYDDVISFYKREMPANDWEIVLLGSLETDPVSLLRFQKDERSAIVTITRNPVQQNVLVAITITGPQE